MQDKGYQGIQKLHSNSRLPKKKPRGGQLSAEDKAYNRQLARERVVIEPVNRCLKIFRNELLCPIPLRSIEDRVSKGIASDASTP